MGDWHAGLPAGTVEPGRSRSGRVLSALAAVACLYPLVMLCAHVRGRGSSLSLAPLNDDWLLGAQALTLLAVVLRACSGLGAGARRRAWVLLAITLALDLVLEFGWALLSPEEAAGGTAWDDAIWMAHYIPGLLMLCAFYRALGGNWARPGALMDAAILVVAILAATVPFHWTPFPTYDPTRHGGLLTASAYSSAVLAIYTVSALVYLEARNWAVERGALLAIAGFLVCVTVDAWEVTQRLRDSLSPGGVQHLVTCVGYTLMALGAAQAVPREQPAAREAADEFQRLSILPVLAILIALTATLMSQDGARTPDLAVAAGLTIAGAVLVITRHWRGRAHVRRLHEELLTRRAEEKLTELVRRSRDVFCIADPAGAIVFLSPSATTQIGVDPAAQLGRPAAQLLGPASAAALGGLLAGLPQDPATVRTVELDVATPDGHWRVLEVTASDERRNPLIRGTTLTLHDVTDQRALERAMVRHLSQDRQQASADMHEGVAQDLAGVTMMLGSLAAPHASATPALAADLQRISAQLARTIAAVRSLAQHLSPTSAMAGSVSAALQHVVLRATAEGGPRVALHCELGALEPSAFTADELCRIVADAIELARSASEPPELTVTLSDWQRQWRLGLAYDFGANLADPGAPALRLLRYRVRLLGGTMHLAPVEQNVLAVEILIPREAQVSLAT